MAQTDYLGLPLTLDSDDQMTFLEWRRRIDGDSDSDMIKIDAAISDINSKVDLKQDKVIGTDGQIVGFDSSGNMVAQEAPVTGVSSFNGRAKDVMPQTGDYTAEMVGARPSDWLPTASEIGADLYGAAADVQDALNNHATTLDIHVTAEQKAVWNKKQDAISGAATTIISNDLTPNRVAISNDNGKVAVSTVSTSELEQLSGVLGNIQKQLDSKADDSHGLHVEFSTAVPVVADTAATGSATTVARSDHAHPAQTTVSGNAGSATKLETSRTIQTDLGSATSASFDGSTDVTPGVKGILPLAHGGTGVQSLSALQALLGGGSSSIETYEIFNDTVEIDVSFTLDYDISDFDIVMFQFDGIAEKNESDFYFYFGTPSSTRLWGMHTLFETTSSGSGYFTKIYYVLANMGSSRMVSLFDYSYQRGNSVLYMGTLGSSEFTWPGGTSAIVSAFDGTSPGDIDVMIYGIKIG